MRAVHRFLDGGDKVKVTMRFRGREMVHQEIGLKVLERVRDELEERVKVEQMPRLEGRQMIMVLAPKYGAGADRAGKAMGPAEGRRHDRHERFRAPSRRIGR